MAVWGMTDKTYPQPQPTACFAIPEGRGALSDPEGKGEIEKVVTISLTDGRRLRKRTVLGWEYRFVNDVEIDAGRMVGVKEKPAQWKVMEVEVGHRRNDLGERPGVDDYLRVGATGFVRRGGGSGTRVGAVAGAD